MRKRNRGTAANKPAALKADRYVFERAARADVERALEVLERAGSNEAPREGDELPDR